VAGRQWVRIRCEVGTFFVHFAQKPPPEVIVKNVVYKPEIRRGASSDFFKIS
jgi:hypothetical protein